MNINNSNLINEMDILKMGYNRNFKFPDACLHELFKEQVIKTPNKVAMTCQGESITYFELDQLTGNLSNYLVHEGVGLETIVAICTERSLDLIAILLGVLKSGGCYLFIEPNSPPARIAQIFENASPSVLITLDEFPISLPETTIKHLKLTKEWKSDVKNAVKSKFPDEIKISPNNLAYISYTSGSTGTPKGVCISHASVARLVKGWAKMNPEDVFLQVSSCAFDASTLEIWSPLVNGGKLVSYGPGVVLPDRLAETIISEGVTITWLTSGMFHAMIENHIEAFSSVKHVISGGDVVSSKYLNQLVTAYPQVIFTNGYGPTENTTFTTCWSRMGKKVDGTVPIGKPISGTAVLILDENLDLVPVNKPGELYVTGEGLARGYVNDAMETACKFLPNPYSTTPGERMYKTGDLARWNSDGEIEFLGRIDNQIKIRGYRVDLTEIELTLMSHFYIKNCVVVSQNDRLGGKQIIAYIVLDSNYRDDSAHKITEIHNYLKEYLPPYMVPMAIIPIYDIPLTLNGKIDRNALSSINRTPRSLNTQYIPPRSEKELKISKIWGEYLLVEPIGVYDDFFELGGHSLMAGQVILEMNRTLNIEVPARIFYLNPTIVGLLEEIELIYGK